MSALAPIVPKIDPLIRRLASSSDGEVVATVRALKRQLGKHGLDLNDLADCLAATLEPAPDAVPPVFCDYAAAIRWCLEADRGELSVRDREFLRDMSRILSRYPPRPKQAAWIRSLVERLGGVFDG